MMPEERRVLLVEDEPLISMMLEDMMGDIGYVVAGSARDTKGALEYIEAEDLDVALLDVHLADGDCFGLADALLARGVPVIFSTGVGRDEIPAPYDQYPYVTKPFDMRQLEAALVKVLMRPAAEQAPRPQRLLDEGARPGRWAQPV